MAIRILRGLETERTGIVPLAGQPLFAKQADGTWNLYLGDGITAGGVLVSSNIQALTDIADVPQGVPGGVLRRKFDDTAYEWVDAIVPDGRQKAYVKVIQSPYYEFNASGFSYKSADNVVSVLDFSNPPGGVTVTGTIDSGVLHLTSSGADAVVQSCSYTSNFGIWCKLSSVIPSSGEGFEFVITVDTVDWHIDVASSKFRIHSEGSLLEEVSIQESSITDAEVYIYYLGATLYAKLVTTSEEYVLSHEFAPITECTQLKLYTDGQEFDLEAIKFLDNPALYLAQEAYTEIQSALDAYGEFWYQEAPEQALYVIPLALSAPTYSSDGGVLLKILPREFTLESLTEVPEPSAGKVLRRDLANTGYEWVDGVTPAVASTQITKFTVTGTPQLNEVYKVHLNTEVFSYTVQANFNDEFEGSDNSPPNPAFWVVSDATHVHLNNNRLRVYYGGEITAQWYTEGNFSMDVFFGNDILHSETPSNSPAILHWYDITGAPNYVEVQIYKNSSNGVYYKLRVCINDTWSGGSWTWVGDTDYSSTKLFLRVSRLTESVSFHGGPSEGATTYHTTLSFPSDIKLGLKIKGPQVGATNYLGIDYICMHQDSGGLYTLGSNESFSANSFVIVQNLATQINGSLDYSAVAKDSDLWVASATEGSTYYAVSYIQGRHQGNTFYRQLVSPAATDATLEPAPSRVPITPESGVLDGWLSPKLRDIPEPEEGKFLYRSYDGTYQWSDLVNYEGIWSKKILVPVQNPAGSDVTGWSGDIVADTFLSVDCFRLGDVAEPSCSQTLDISTLLELSQIDSGDCRFLFMLKRANGTNGEPGSIKVQFLDSTQAELEAVENIEHSYTPSIWFQEELQARIPSGTRSILINVSGTRLVEPSCDVYFTEVSCEVHIPIAKKLEDIPGVPVPTPNSVLTRTADDHYKWETTLTLDGGTF